MTIRTKPDTGTAHTEGPWQTNGGIVRTVDENSITVRKIATVHGEFGEAEKIANARLIAAAPELLEALKATLGKWVDLVESGDAGFWDAEEEPHVIAARAAIARAEGRQP